MPITAAPPGINAGNRFIAQTSGGVGGGSIYDPLNRIVKIVETRNGSVTSTKQFIWDGDQLCEERDASGNVTRRFFVHGEQIAGTNYFYTHDHLGSVREMSDGSGVVQAAYGYDPFGRVTKTQGSLDSDFQYAGMYAHQPSGLNLAVHRAYDPRLGRWLSRDPIDELSFGITAIEPEPTGQAQLPMMVPSINPYFYTGNNPIGFRDPSGLEQTQAPGIKNPSGGKNAPYVQRPPYDSCPLKKYNQNRGPNGTGPQIQNFNWGSKSPYGEKLAGGAATQ